MKIQAVLFDMGETLIRDVDAWEKSVGAIYNVIRKYISDISKEKIDILLKEWKNNLPGDVEYSTRLKIMRILRRIGLDPKPWLVDILHETYINTVGEGYVWEEDAYETILQLKNRGIKVGIVSNAGSYDSIRNMLIKNGLYDAVDLVLVSQSVVWPKPNKIIFLLATELLNVRPANTIFVGNDPKCDIEGAKSVGMIAIQKVSKEFSKSEKADFVIKKIREILSILEILESI